MARVHIDISVFTPDSSFGVVSGAMEVPDVPQVGEHISFDHPPAALTRNAFPQTPPRLEVEHVLPAPLGTEEVLVMLSDLTLVTREDAQKMVNYLQDGFGLIFDEHDI